MSELIIKILLAYLIGSVSGSLLLGRIKKVDIRLHGSGNPGGTNAFRTQGVWFGLAVLIIDMGKGILATWWVPTLALPTLALPGLALPTLALMGSATEVFATGSSVSIVVLACGFAAIVGHCYPIWHGFRGGKGAATAVGTLIVIEPWLILPVMITWLLVLIITGYVGLATILASLSMAPVAWLMSNTHLLVYVSLIALFLLFTHRSNVRNMRSGTEHRFQTSRFFTRKS